MAFERVGGADRHHAAMFQHIATIRDVQPIACHLIRERGNDPIIALLCEDGK